MFAQNDLQQRMQQVIDLVRRIENLPDPEARASSIELMQTMMDVHGAALERMMELTSLALGADNLVFDKFAEDDLAGGLLLLYGLHPVDVQTRVTRALDKVRPYLKSHGGDVELLGFVESGVNLRLQGSCHGCPSSMVTLKLAIEDAIRAAAPDLEEINVDGVVEETPPSGLVQLGTNRSQSTNSAPEAANRKWEEVKGLDAPWSTDVRAMEVKGRSVVFCRVGEDLYAFGGVCPGCGNTMGDARLEAGNLVCSNCREHYDCKQAGRGIGQENNYLVAVPLLMEQGKAMIALSHLAAG